MTSGPLAVGAAVVSIAGVVAVGAATDRAVGTGAPPRAGSAAVTDVQLVCPGLDGSAGAPLTVTVADMRSALGRTAGPPTVAATPLTGGGASAATLAPSP